MSGRLGDLSQEQETALAGLREKVALRSNEDKDPEVAEGEDVEAAKAKETAIKAEFARLNDTDLLRFLRARSFDVDKAFSMISECCEWRVTFPVSACTLEDSHKHLEKGGSFFRNRDKAGRPVNWVRVKTHKKGDAPIEEVERACIYWMERGCGILDAETGVESKDAESKDAESKDAESKDAESKDEESKGKESKDEESKDEESKEVDSTPEKEDGEAKKTPVDSFTLVFDMNGFGLVNMDYAFIKFLIGAFEKYYPERLGKGLIVDSPWIFWGCWKLIAPWLDKRTASKIEFVSKAQLLEHIAEENVMGFLGGKDDWEFKFDVNDTTGELGKP